MGFKSGEYGGQGITSIPISVKKAITLWALCIGVLSYIKTLSCSRIVGRYSAKTSR
jgi:hypothetical protein